MKIKEKQLIRMNIELKKVDLKTFTINGIFSTADEDRHGDIVEQNWDLKNFKANPVILNSHNYQDATEVVGKAIEISVIKKETIKSLEGSIQFAVNENPKAKIIFDLYAGGFLSAFSVGFMPKEFDDKGRILKSELLEISAVSVPANAMALAKAKGIDVDKLYDKSLENDNEGEDAEDDSEGEGEASDGEGESDDSDDSEEGGENNEGDDTAEETIVEPEIKEEVKTAKQLAYEVVKSEVDIRKNALAKILKAVNLVSNEFKVDGCQAKDKAGERALLNKTIKKLLEVKKID